MRGGESVCVRGDRECVCGRAGKRGRKCKGERDEGVGEKESVERGRERDSV